jgi:hypothetical protein
MRYLMVALLLVSCSKEMPVKEINGLSFQAGGKNYFYANPVITSEPFCDKVLYSISGSNTASEELLISVVTKKLTTGSYPAGLSYWGKYLLSNDITLNVISSDNGCLTATFAGSTASGELRHVRMN